jgi:outer membrane receptor protein involved in Fe transport
MSAFGQAETGQILGNVLDPTGASVPGSTVIIRAVSTGAERSQSTDAAGTFTFTNLPPDDYEIIVTAAGFTTIKQRATVSVGSKVGLDIKLEVGKSETVIEVSESAVTVNTETQTISQLINSQDINELPSLTRNPYDFVVTSGNVSEDDPSGRGVGVAMNGLRSAGTNVMLDGVANNNEFTAAVGQMTPMDSVQEYSIITNNFTAEYGRADAGVVNVSTKSGTNAFHGTLYEFGRYSDLASNSFNNNAYAVDKPHYTRNQFGYSLGGPIKKDKLFFFSNTEWTRVRSVAVDIDLVPDPALIAAAAPATQSVFSSYGTLRPGATILSTLSRNQLTNTIGDPCAGASSGGPCMSYNPSAPMFDLVSYNVPSDSGAGVPQNTWNTVERFDYNLNDRTQIYGRYAGYSESDFSGSNSNNVYAGYDTPITTFNNSVIVSMTHTFSPRFVSQSKLDFNRFNILQPLASTGVVPNYYLASAESASSLGPYDILLPGYLPTAPGSGIPFGGPQNFGEFYQDFSVTRGRHEFRFGGTAEYLRDNRTFGAYEENTQSFGVSGNTGEGLDNFLLGQLQEDQIAMYPQGKFPCVNGVQTPSCTLTLPVGPPTFERSNRYHEYAFYGQDSWKVSPRFTINLGLRWEYFGVQHNVDANLDSNFYPANNPNPYLAIADGAVDTAPTSPIGELWKPSWKNFGPRVGFAWDIFGDGKTAFRGGYGIGYERNFGNVTYNVLFNPPNYAVVQLLAGSNGTATIPVTAGNFPAILSGTGTAALPASELRAVAPNIPQAYAHLISASLEHQFANSMHLEVDYSGSIGENLYDIADVNTPGTGNVYLGIPCTPANTLSGGPGACFNTLNDQYSAINRRGAGGISNYNAMNVRYDIQDIKRSGLTLRLNYTWSHTMDELSDTFSSCANCENLGYTDPFNPRIDYGPANFDNRHRIAVSGIWEVPFARNLHGPAKAILDGWELAPILTARTGAPYSIYDFTNDEYVATRVAADQVLPVTGGRTNIGANNFQVYNFANYSVDESYLSPLTGDADFGPWPGNFTGRNYFHSPGTWNLNLGMYKSTRITERATLQLRLEAYNAFNHANFGVNVSSAYIADCANGSCALGSVSGSYNGNRNVQLGAKLVF